MTTENTHEFIFLVACYSPLSSSLGVVIREQAALFWGHYPQRQSRSRWQFIGEKSPLRCPLYAKLSGHSCHLTHKSATIDA